MTTTEITLVESLRLGDRVYIGQRPHLVIKVGGRNGMVAVTLRDLERDDDQSYPLHTIHYQAKASVRRAVQ